MITTVTTAIRRTKTTRKPRTENFTVGTVLRVRATEIQPKINTTHIMNLLAEITGSIQGGLGCLGAAIGVGLVGFKAAEAVGRNPGASTKILVQGIIGMALAEAVAFYALFLGK
jgi:F-type H+-transporting ATPase subunit c